MNIIRPIVCFSLLFFLNPSVFSADLDREKRLASQIVDSVMDGDVVELTADKHQFMGIYMQSDNHRGAVLILHGRGYHADWESVVQPLRIGLNEHGWNTLSIQLPVLEKEAKYFDYVPLFDESVPRIESAIAYLKEQGNEKIILIAHSCGGHMANRWIIHTGGESIAAFVGIGMGATDKGQPMVDPFAMNKLRAPVLDVYGHEDYSAVHRMASDRLKQIIQADSKLSRQEMVPEADHYFTGKGDALVEVVSAWLDELWPK